MALKLTHRLILLFVLFAALLLGSLGGLVYASARGALQNAVEADLYSTALEKRAALDGWLADRQASLAGLSRSPALLANAELLTTVGAPAAHGRLVEELQARVDANLPFLRLFVLHPNSGRILASTSPADEGKYHEQSPYFRNGRSAPYVQSVQYLIEEQRPAMIASAPLRGADGQLIGVLAGELNINDLTMIVQRHAGLRPSEDAFLINTSGLFVTQPLLLTDPAVLRRGIRTAASQRCLAGGSGTILADDYLNIPVIVRYTWLEDRQLCLIVKRSQRDAFAASDELGWQVLGFGGMMLGLGLIVAILLARTITGPIITLQAGVARFTAGERGLRLPDAAPDEVGALVGGFNQMVQTLSVQEAELKRYAEGLEQLIVARTEELRISEELFRNAFEQAAVGIAYSSIEGRYLRCNQRLCDIVGYTNAELLELCYQDITHPDDLEEDLAFHQRLIEGDERRHGMEKRYIHKSGRLVWINLRVSLMRDLEGRPIYFNSVFEDITDRKRIAADLQARTEDLARSNAELEQFAYVASHDLQEPLRMVSSYTQLLARRYKGKLDADADEFIGYAVDGATRMQKLINDLLAYSRVGTRGKPFAPVDCQVIFDQVLANLSLAIEDSGAVVTHSALPTLIGDDTQLAQLFQNLIGNALKFHGAEPPQVHVAAERQDRVWLFSVCDNGIGIEPAYFERVFVIFQRLHTRDEYAGTGIGLAICKKIVTRHGGRIWIESTLGEGTTFFFTLAAAPHAGWRP